MKKLSLLLLLFVAKLSWAANGSGNVTQTVGLGGSKTSAGAPITCSVGQAGTAACKMLYAAASSGSSATYLKFYDGGVQYQVPSGKTFTVLGFTHIAGLSGASYLGFGYATATFLNNITGPPTGAVQYGNAYQDMMQIKTVAGALEYEPIGGFTFPALSYPFVRYGNSNYVTIFVWGVEQ